MTGRGEEKKRGKAESVKKKVTDRHARIFVSKPLARRGGKGIEKKAFHLGCFVCFPNIAGKKDRFLFSLTLLSRRKRDGALQLSRFSCSRKKKGGGKRKSSRSTTTTSYSSHTRMLSSKGKKGGKRASTTRTRLLLALQGPPGTPPSRKKREDPATLTTKGEKKGEGRKRERPDQRASSLPKSEGLRPAVRKKEKEKGFFFPSSLPFNGKEEEERGKGGNHPLPEFSDKKGRGKGRYSSSLFFPGGTFSTREKGEERGGSSATDDDSYA